jgi:hypothetical protein
MVEESVFENVRYFGYLKNGLETLVWAVKIVVK